MRRWTFFVVAALMGLGLAACGTGNVGTEPAPAPSSTPGSVVEPDEGETTPAGSGGAAETGPVCGCEATPPDFGAWMTSQSTTAFPITGATYGGADLVLPTWPYRVFYAAVDQGIAWAAPLPLTVGGELIELGRVSNVDGSWTWSADLDATWLGENEAATQAAVDAARSCYEQWLAGVRSCDVTA